MTVPVAIALFVLNVVALAAIRYESMRKDVLQNKKDLGGVAGIARDALERTHRMEIMEFYLALSIAPEDPARREKVMAAMFEAAIQKKM